MLSDAGQDRIRPVLETGNFISSRKFCMRKKLKKINLHHYIWNKWIVAILCAVKTPHLTIPFKYRRSQQAAFFEKWQKKLQVLPVRQSNCNGGFKGICLSYRLPNYQIEIALLA